MTSLLEVLQYGFFRRALLEAVIVGALGGAVGVHVLLRRLPFFVVAVSHATFPGLVVASLMGVSLVAGGVAAAVLLALFVAVFGTSRVLDGTTVTGVVLAGAFALGIVLLNAFGSPDGSLERLLVGSILTVERGDLVLTGVFALAVVTVIALLHKELVLSSFDPEGATALGYRRPVLDLVALVLVGVVTVLAIPAVGALLALALLTVPALTARLWVDRVGHLMVLSPLVGAACALVGLCLSAQWSLAPGGSIALTCGAAFVASAALRWERL